MNYYEHHLGDYLRDTAHLSIPEDGAYRRLLDQYYIREQPLPTAPREVYRLVRAQSRQDREAVDTVLREFFVETPEGWRHSRCDREIDRFQGKQAKARASAEARWKHMRSHEETDANASPTADANAMRTHSERNANGMHRAPVPRHQTPDTSLAAELQTADRSLPGIDPPPPTPAAPPPPFDGLNAERLNGKAVVELAPGFELPEEWGRDAEKLGWKAPEVLHHAERFRQYWTAGKGKGTRRSVTGWRQTWGNWLDKEARQRR